MTTRQMMVWTPSLCLLLLGAGACGVDDAEPPGSDAAAVSPDAGPNVTPDARPDGVVAPDTKPAFQTRPTTVKCDDDKHATCAAACQAKGASCSSACAGIGAGKASYGYYDWTYGWTKVVTSIKLPDCGQTPDKKTTHQGKEYQLAYWYCCCEMPVVTTVKGDMSNLQSCNAICAAAGKTCYPHHKWSSGKTGGMKMWYQRQSTGGSAYLYGGCSGAPKPRVTYAGAERDLMSYTCACY